MCIKQFLLFFGITFFAINTARSNNNIPVDTVFIQKEEDFYTITTVPIPSHIVLEVGGMVFLPGDKLAICTRRGEVWIVTNPYMRNGEAPEYRLFATGLHEPLGLNYLHGDLYAVQRSEVTRLRDLDADGEADEYKTVYSWPLAANYHEYAYGSIVDLKGDMVINRNLAWTNSEKSLSIWDGWMLKVDTAGNMRPFAAGLRSPAGMAITKDGSIFYSENQGGWVASGFIAHVEEGDFMGNPEGLIWSGESDSPVKLRKEDIPDLDEPKYDVSKRVLGLKPPAVWLPHGIMGISTSDILIHDELGKMGPFEGQFFVGDQGQSKIMRISMEKVNGVHQGVAFPFRSDFSSGVLRMQWGSDGSMFVGMTNRGWGSFGPEPYGLQRIEWNGKTPFEMKTIKAMPDGFEIELTESVDRLKAMSASFMVTSFTYKYGHKYGSPVINESKHRIVASDISKDGYRIRLVIDSLRLGYIHEIKVEGLKSVTDHMLMHNVGYYTLNQIPEGISMEINEGNRILENHDLKAHKNHVAANQKQMTPGMDISAVSKRLLTKPSQWNDDMVQTVVLNPANNLKFIPSVVTIKAGTKVKLVFANTDDMPHNVVITEPGAADEVGEAALNMGLSGERQGYVPSLSKVLFHTTLIHPGSTETIYFTAPSLPGNYQYVCTYPGHYKVMRGILKVVGNK